MAGGTHGRRGMAAAVIFLAGCVGLGDSPSGMVAYNRSPAPTVDPDAPPRRSADDAPAQSEPDIPIVPLPPLTSPAKATPRSVSPPPVVPVGTTTPPTSTSPAQPAPQADGTEQSPPHTARQLLQRAASRCAGFDSYIVRLTRREHLKNKGNPEEIIAFSFRKNPFSVHLKWLGDTAKGREVVYVKGRFDSKIHTKVAAGDAPLLPAGARLSLSPDNPLVRGASRHPITDAGIGHCVETLTAQLDAQERGDRRQGTITAIAPQRRPEYAKPVETLERTIPPGVEPELPHGGRRLIYFDPDWQLPLLVATYDDKGNEVEYYRYDRLMTPANLDDDDFNPDKLWAAPPAANSPHKQQ
jgi:hypothetical protein